MTGFLLLLGCSAYVLYNQKTQINQLTKNNDSLNNGLLAISYRLKFLYEIEGKYIKRDNQRNPVERSEWLVDMLDEMDLFKTKRMKKGRVFKAGLKKELKEPIPVFNHSSIE